MLTLEQKKQFSEILEEFGNVLDITKDQHEKAEQHYQHIANWLAANDSPLTKFNPQIKPQGSFMLGTMIKPINDGDQLDVDLVCQFEGKMPEWTQFNLKQIVGKRLQDNEIIKKLIEIPDGRRCWKLNYAESARFHMDILPCIVSVGYTILYEKAFSAILPDYNALSIRITDKKESNYHTSVNPDEWLSRNPFSYGFWFEEKARILTEQVRLMSDSIKPLPGHQSKKLPLQRVVQILKRHRDMMFNGDEDKPISIIITTLAAQAYQKETNILEALMNVVQRMPSFIEERHSPDTHKSEKWISNPVHMQENFADKWAETPRKKDNFYKWLAQVQKDILFATQQTGLSLIQDSLKRPFGDKDIAKTFSNYGERLRLLRESGNLKMASGTGILGSIGTTLGNHSFHGED
ncbi:MAG: nucleotidyltransferase [Bacteroidales bacterium]|jgi:hypothetical protein|nr:nucleotidyltransferase [Bacteroidales bacterium]